jgi:DNA (cytosine-5)-methyltransferase 1
VSERRRGKVDSLRETGITFNFYKMDKFIYTKDNPLRVFTAFSGYDSQCMALDRIGIPYELVGWSEIDKYAIQAHNALYPAAAGKNYGDISKVDWNAVSDFDLFTYSFPCTDISNAGQQKGLEEGSGTRSSLLWECKKAIEVKRPKYLLMENVKALVSQKFLPFYKKWEQFLAEMGYDNYCKVINATECGVPQNRERIFIVSILDNDKAYHFPEPIPLEKRLKDVLEPEVDDKYVLSDTAIEGFLKHNENHEAKGTGFI